VFERKEFLFVLKYSFWQLLSVLGIYVINIGMNYVLVFNKVAVANIGLFNFSYKLFSGFSPFFGLFGIVIPKWVHGKDKAGLHNRLMVRFFFSICFLAVLYLVIAFILKPFMILVGKEDYLQSVYFFIYLFPAFLLLSYTNLMNTVIMNTVYFKQAQFAILFQGAALLLFSFPLVRLFGIEGALCSITLSFFIATVYLYFLYNKKVKINFA
jgi:O-antigen/teichoic acid export membrane protein